MTETAQTRGPTGDDDLGLICEIALEWAGEYGWSPAMRPQAEKVIDAIRRLRPDALPTELR